MADRSPTVAFIGRTPELATLGRAIANARDGVPSVLLIGGDAGIGKSTLIAEAARRAHVRLYLGRCMHLGGDVIPLAPLTDLLRQIRRSAPGSAGGQAGSVLWRWSNPDSGERPSVGAVFADVLDQLGDLAVADSLVVAFEDLHWADVATWDLFEYLARNLVDHRVVLVGTYRADETGSHPAQRRRLAELSRLPSAHRIHLGGFDRDEVTACVAALIGTPAPHGLVEEICARGEGNPFFTEELVVARTAGNTIPLVLSDLISADIAGLDEPARHTLSVIAAVGRGTPHDLLIRIADLDDGTVEAAVRAARDAHVLVVDASTSSYRFRHALIGEVVYEDLLPPQRARLHRRIAEALQEQPAEVLARADRAGELAFHLDHAGDRGAAFAAYLGAVDAAEAVAPGTALAHLERAFELWDEAGTHAADARRADRMWQAAELAAPTIGNERAVEIARAAFHEGPPPQGAAWGHERLGRYLWSSGRLDESRAEFEHAAATLSAGDDRGAAPVFAGLGQAEVMSGRYDTAEQWCDKVFGLVPSPEADRLPWVMARRVLGLARNDRGDPERGVELCRESFTAAPSPQTRALATLYLGTALLDAARNHEAVNLALDAVAEGHLAGLDRSFGGYLDALAATGLTRLGRWAEAAALLERHTGYDTLPVGALRVACARALLAARRGDGDGARAFVTDALAQPVDGWHQTVRDAAVAEVHLALGEWAHAGAAAERGWTTTTDAATLWRARFAMLTVEAAVERALDRRARREPVDPPAIVDHLRRRLDAVTVGAAASGAHPSIDTAAHLAHAVASLTRLTSPDADAWAEAAHRWDARGDRWWTAVARLHEADAAAAAGASDRAARSLRAAHLAASEIGAAPLSAQIAAVSRRTRLSLEAPTRVILDQTSAEHLGLTTREAEVLGLVAIGRTNRQIGEELFVSEKTASVHVSNIMRKLGVTSRVDAAAVAQRLGIG